MAKTRCLICNHPQSAEIDKALAMPGASMASIAKMFGVHWSTLGNHQKKHIPTFLAAVEQSSREVRGLDVKAVVFQSADVLSKSLRACDKWLTDPNNSNEYTFEPRAHEISVIYVDKADRDEKGNPKRKKANLQRLLDMATVPDREIEWAKDQTVDVWSHSLKTVREWNDLIDRWAKLNGLYQQERKNEFDEREFFKKEIERLQAEGWEYEQAVSIVLAADDTGTASQYVK